MLSLEFHPSEDTLNSFLPILEKEYIENGKTHGIYCNWDIIKSRHHKDQLIVCRNGEEAVGFLAWRRDDKIVTLEIIWVNPNTRGQGVGLEFQRLLEKEFKKRGDVALSLYCSSVEGLSLANRAGFEPKSSKARIENAIYNLGPQASYIKILKNSTYTNFFGDNIEIRCFEGGYGGRGELFATLPLNVDFSANPVYRYVDYDWWGKVVCNGIVIRERKLKYLLQDLKIRLFDYQVALFDKKTPIPPHWIINK